MMNRQKLGQLDQIINRVIQIELMNEMQGDFIRKQSAEPIYGGSGGMFDNYTSPLNRSESESRLSRMNYSVPQSGVQGRKIFGFEIFVDNDILRELGSEGEWFDKVKTLGNVESIRFNLDLNIPDLNGRNIQIFDRDMDRKYQSCRGFLSDIYQVFKKLRREPFSIIIFVPEGMVSLLIGTKGYQINKIMRQSHTTIVVNQPINRMTYRTVKIQGYHSDIAKACRIIYEILEDKSSIAYSIEKEPSQLDYTKARVKTKFILCSSLLNYLLSKKRSFIKRLEEQTKCIIKFKEDTSSRLLRRDEELCVLFGKLEDVQAFLVMLVNLIQFYYEEDRKGHDYTFKMLIPSNYVTKLIGQKGYMIRDIIERSGGAQIKILSDRQSQRDARECIISINGTRQNKIDAACLILEQIECFKNGGPILQSGKSINENLAQQFKNSLPLHKSDEFVDDTEHTAKMMQIIDKSMEHHFKSNYQPPQDNNEEEGLIELEQGEQAQQPEQIAPKKQTPSANECKMDQQDNAAEQNKEIETAKVTLKEEVCAKIMEEPIEAESDPKIQKNIKQQLQVSNLDENSKIGENIAKQQSPQKAEEKREAFQSPSRRSEVSGSSPSRSRKKRRMTELKANRSSPSSEYQQDREFVEVKLVIPRKLAQDYKQLKYIESLCHSQITIRDQRVQGSGEAIISVRGTLKDNSQCIKLLQKRIMRLAAHSSSGR